MPALLALGCNKTNNVDQSNTTVIGQVCQGGGNGGCSSGACSSGICRAFCEAGQCATNETCVVDGDNEVCIPNDEMGAGSCEPEQVEFAGSEQHLVISACRDTQALDAAVDEGTAIFSCDTADLSRPEFDVTADFGPDVGRIVFKFKDLDLSTLTVPAELAEDSDLRIEWELKDTDDVSQCDQPAGSYSVVFESVPDASAGGTLSGTLDAAFSATPSLATQDCPATLVHASFAVDCIP